MTIEPVTLVAQAWDRYTPWACLRVAGVRADRLGGLRGIIATYPSMAAFPAAAAPAGAAAAAASDPE